LSGVSPPYSTSPLEDLPNSLGSSPVAGSHSGSTNTFSTQLEDFCNDVGDLTASITREIFLFDHYMQHTCHDLEKLPSVAHARKVGIPELAAKNQGILCSVMALGAACLCMDRLSGGASCNRVEELHELIAAGDRYHCWALESARLQMTSSEPEDLAESHAHSILLLPYTTARKQISRMLSGHHLGTPLSASASYDRFLDSSDWMIVLRGITTTGRAAWPENSVTSSALISRFPMRQTDPTIARHILQQMPSAQNLRSVIGSENQTPASKHVLFPILAKETPTALQALHNQVETLSKASRDEHRRNIPSATNETMESHVAQSLSLVACTTAIDLLVDLGMTLFNPELAPSPSPATSPSVAHLDGTYLPWLRRYAVRPVYEPDLPACRTVLAWVNRLPTEFFHLLMQPLPKPTLGQRVMLDLKRDIHILALDIWAHFLVFTILIEDESLLMGNLATPDLSILAPLFRAHGISAELPSAEKQEWWPWSMAVMAQQLKSFQM
jgi:hypothetical protein